MDSVLPSVLKWVRGIAAGMGIALVGVAGHVHDAGAQSVPTKTFDMPGDAGDQAGIHIGDCLIKRYGAKVILMGNGTGKLEADVRSEDSGDEMRYTWEFIDSNGKTLFSTFQKSPRIPQSKDFSWRGSFTFSPDLYNQVDRAVWVGGECH